MPEKKESMTNKVLSARMKSDEWKEFEDLARECGLSPDTHGFQKDAIMEFMARTKDYNQDLKERVGALTSAKRRALLKMIESSTVTENLYQYRRKKQD